MTVDKPPSWFARLRGALSHRPDRLPWKSVLLLIALAVLFFWLHSRAAWLEQRLPPFLQIIVQPFEYVVVFFALGWALHLLWKSKSDIELEFKFPPRDAAMKIGKKKKKLRKKEEERTLSSYQAEPGSTKSAPPEPDSTAEYQQVQVLPEAAEKPSRTKSGAREPDFRGEFQQAEAFPEAAEAPSDFVLGSEPEFAVVRVFYATDRQSTGQDLPSRFYGKEQSSDGKLSMGTCEVSIPRDHRIGELEHPSIWRLEFSEDPEKHVVLLRVNPQSEDDYWADVRNRVGSSRKKEAFVFVHGYNTTFEDAARRTAQLAYDLTFEGAAIFYSWPSYGELADYAKDENNAYWTVPHLKDFLAALAAQTEAETIHLIAHSMGNRPVSYALQLLAHEVGPMPCRMHHVVLTAPDIDANTFKELAKDVKSVSDRVTLYVSPFDKALALSKRFHGNPRLGETILVIPGIDTIDASSVDTSLIGHGYYAESTSVLTDIFYLLKDDKAPGDRFGMRPVDRPDGTYYEFRPTNR